MLVSRKNTVQLGGSRERKENEKKVRIFYLYAVFPFPTMWQVPFKRRLGKVTRDRTNKAPRTLPDRRVTSLLHESWVNALDAYVRPPTRDCSNVHLMQCHLTRNKTEASGGNKEQHTSRNPSPVTTIFYCWKIFWPALFRGY